MKLPQTILFIFGTRPEAIKMAPLIHAFQEIPGYFTVKVCVTGQHRQMLDQILDFFDIVPDIDLNMMVTNQTLFDITSIGLKKLEQVLENIKPDIIFVQGDTTTTFIGALAGYYKKIKVAHLEAGLRSGVKYSPFPEELNRTMTGHIADFHFAPTQQAVASLAREGITTNVWNVGNTVIDALLWGLELLQKNNETSYVDFFNFLKPDHRIILVTGHRRESFGEPFENICKALCEIALHHPNVEIVYPVHLNPNVQKPVFSMLNNVTNMHLIDPLPYPYLLWLMKKCTFVLTDSGGIQEEAPSLGKPVLVMREVTERMEGVEAGTAKLVGTSQKSIVTEAVRLLNDPIHYHSMAQAVNPYGDGQTSQRIVKIFMEHFYEKKP